MIAHFIQLDSGAFNFRGGIGYALTLLFVWALTSLGGLVTIGGLAALLIWLSDMPGGLKRLLASMTAFGVFSIPIIRLPRRVPSSQARCSKMSMIVREFAIQ
jgi:hypothetical protein